MHREELEVTADLNELISVAWHGDCVFQTLSVKRRLLGWAALGKRGLPTYLNPPPPKKRIPGTQKKRKVECFSLFISLRL